MREWYLSYVDVATFRPGVPVYTYCNPKMDMTACVLLDTYQRLPFMFTRSAPLILLP